MIRIEHLEIQFDVTGDEDERVFVELFNRYIADWNQRQKEAKNDEDRLRKSALLMDRHDGGT